MVSAEALTEGVLRIIDGRRNLTTDEMRALLRPWFDAISLVSERDPWPESTARMAMLLRASGLTHECLALCDQADRHERPTGRACTASPPTSTSRSGWPRRWRTPGTARI